MHHYNGSPKNGLFKNVHDNGTTHGPPSRELPSPELRCTFCAIYAPYIHRKQTQHDKIHRWNSLTMPDDHFLSLPFGDGYVLSEMSQLNSPPGMVGTMVNENANGNENEQIFENNDINIGNNNNDNNVNNNNFDSINFNDPHLDYFLGATGGKSVSIPQTPEYQNYHQVVQETTAHREEKIERQRKDMRNGSKTIGNGHDNGNKNERVFDAFGALDDILGSSGNEVNGHDGGGVVVGDSDSDDYGELLSMQRRKYVFFFFSFLALLDFFVLLDIFLFLFVLIDDQ